ncbi:DUF1496 domain-containing protein [Photobacterium angustum]|uniref:DUF1496 domain-containing protein n=2 Tax=Photobacterium angustum TaxID=661 RepID=A0A855SF41_PHOAN|nr:DUF1496 domain-containing protein [Photobacterium angustum]PSW97127.1 DUF1496 domain-containing protein [Photobacterium angustum]PSX03378.1 DUF1496 domain-containing protein [Photobacterium angustum]PSX08529.1 DUF1496 domain-containing protein [Photobacterium angustum]PSX10780.1 DUF1496 domain-containing protein [Photobacterium angustum]
MEFGMMKGRSIKCFVISGLVMVLLSLPTQAKTYSVADTSKIEPSIEFNLDGQVTNQRLCFYEDKAYSLGAIIDIDGYKLQCAVENEVELNGRLMWKSLVLVK